MRKIFSLIVFTLVFSFAFAQTPCENGTANGYPCNQVDYYSHIDNNTLAGQTGIEGNDIWGWTDPQTNIEYALMGQTNGTVFVSLQDPSSPQIIGRLATHSSVSTWRDIKTYNNYAFIVADNNSGHGMQVFDLTRLRDATNIPVTFDEDAHYDGVSSAHNVVINPEKGLAYIVGARGASNGCGAGGLHIVDINNPLNPTYAGCFDADGYTHDAQVVTYNGPDEEYTGKQIAFNSNENTITIADVTDPENTTLLSKQGYGASGYAHQGWLTEDHKYFISNDELDELNGLVESTRTLLWDVTDLDNPTLITSYFSGRTSIDHNLYTHNNQVYQSNYESGLIILDAEKIGSGMVRELGYFDTFPQANNISFNGTWSNYPYFNSGIIIVSDINNGLFVLKPSIKDVITSHPAFTTCDLQTSLNISVDDENSVSEYQWQSILDNNVTNLSNNDIYSSVNTSTLAINGENGDISNLKFRCRVTLADGSIAYSFFSGLIGSKPEASFIYNNTDLSFSFISTSSEANTYLWDFGDGATSTEENPVHTFPSSGEYSINLTVTNDCGESTYTEVLDLDLILSSKNMLEQNLKVFPNPFNNELKIEALDSSDKLSLIEIYNAAGAKIEQIKAANRTSISTAHWKEGLYLLVFTDIKGRKAVKRVVKD